ncbi:dentin sialophosphoprotein-related [Abeliophyllum distichum]|uniref:Dentin sialophosphoprotein-related n=1 Tax=Abeliophyllum distichum TaxID=126358 RepID=A0ABD1RUQ3_9LAMI
MFDWNDEELNIIWGEAGESDDHIVPYPDQIKEKPPILFRDYSKKESNQEISVVTPLEKKKRTIRTEHETELECSSKYDTGDPATGFGLPLLNAGKEDHDSMGPLASNKMSEISKSYSSKDETVQLDKESENFQNQTEGKEGDFVDYGWENIGSFDDLDGIFSNSDPIFGDSAVGNADELWSPSKDANNSTTRATLFSGDSSDLELGAIRNASERFENEYLDPSQSFLPEYQNLNEITTHVPQDVQTNFEMGGESQGYSMQLSNGAAPADKGYRKKRVLKGQKLEEKSEVRQLHDLCGTWSSSGSPLQQFNMQCAPSMVNQHPALIPSQLQRPEPLKHKHSSGPLLASACVWKYGESVSNLICLTTVSSRGRKL